MAYSQYILVCGGTGCMSSNAEDIYQNLIREVESNKLQGTVQVVRTGCFGFCEQGPIVKVLPEEAFYVQVKPEDAEEIVAEQCIKGRPVERLLYKENEHKEHARIEDMSFYQKQFRIVLRNCGFINPESIDEYIAREGYEALAKALTELSADDIIAELKDSGLRGRGGAGFPTWMKWKFSKDVENDVKYVVCNADEGDPGAYMDRSVLEGDPHSIIEAMAIAGYTVGAQRGFIYVRAEYPLAIERLKMAIQQGKDYGLLGDNILGTDFSFDIEIRLGAGAFVCGEETALLASIEGERGMPRPRHAALTLNGGEERRLFTTDKGAGAEADLNVKGKIRPQNIVAQEAVVLPLLNGHFQALDCQRVFGADVDEAALRTDGVAGNGHCLNYGVGIALEYAAVHVRSGVALIGVADNVLHVVFNVLGELPLHPGREAGATATAEAGVLELRDDVVRTQLRKRLGEGLVSLSGNVLVNALRIDEAAVAKDNAELLLVEAHVLDPGVLLVLVLLVEETLNGTTLDALLGNDLFRVLRLHLNVERLLREDLHDRPLFAEAEAAGSNNLHSPLEFVRLDFTYQILVDVLGVTGHASGTAADEDILRICHALLLYNVRRGAVVNVILEELFPNDVLVHDLTRHRVIHPTVNDRGHILGSDLDGGLCVIETQTPGLSNGYGCELLFLELM